MSILIPESNSLKEKRGQLKPLIARLHKQFNVSVAEVGNQDRWQQTVIAVAVVSNDAVHSQRLLQEVVEYTGKNWPNMEIYDSHIELI
jgi:uncharacterized protein YlxP (DUF503 family)